MPTKKDTPKPVTDPSPWRVKAGGSKGAAIIAIVTKEPALTRAAIAEKAGATVGRVGEVIRYLAANGTEDERRVIALHVEAQATRSAEAKTAMAQGKAAARVPATKARAKSAAKRPTRKATSSKAVAK